MHQQRFWQPIFNAATAYLSFKGIGHYALVENNHPMESTQSRGHHGFLVSFLSVITRTIPARTLNARAVLADVDSVESSFFCWRILSAEPSWRIQFFSKGYDEAIQVLNVGSPVSSDCIAQAGIGLLSQFVGGCVWEKGILHARGLATKGITNAVQNETD